MSANHSVIHINSILKVFGHDETISDDFMFARYKALTNITVFDAS